MIAAHQENYGPEGPSGLVILWWEWPRTHWNNLRLRISMSFMVTTTPGIIANQYLEGPALEAAIKFVDELISLHVLGPPPPGVSVVNKFP